MLLIAGFAVAPGEWLVDESEFAQLAMEEQSWAETEAPLEPIQAAVQVEEAPPVTIAKPAIQPRPRPQRVRYAYRDADLEEIAGKTRGRIEIVTRSGRQHSGELVSVGTRRVEISKRLNGGSFNYSVNVSDIEKVRVWSPIKS